MHGVLAGFKGPFTPSQWMELEQQALIYKYMNANAPIPASLLIPIRRSLCSSRFTSFSAGPIGPSTFGWGSFHLGFSGNADPEPGRCRRTDGKKWRCSRDAVADQKYCERHMNRGRHRSRKPVEGETGHAAKVMPIIAPTPTPPGSGSSNSFTTAQQQMNNVKPRSTHPAPPQYDRVLANNEFHNSHDLSMLNSVNSEPTETLFPIPDQHNPFEGLPSRADYGPFKHPSNSYLGDDNFVSPVEFHHQDSPTNPPRHFIDDWQKSDPNSSTIIWTEREMQSDKTKLSISIPVASSDLSSSSSSPTHEKHTPSSLKLSLDFNPDDTNVGVGGHPNDGNQRQVSWLRTSWGSSMGGPLGEVLANTCNNLVDHNKNCSSLNLMTNGWDSSPQLRSSPTAVLQKFNFGLLPGITRSSQIAEKHNAQNSIGSLHANLVGSNLVNTSTVTSS